MEDIKLEQAPKKQEEVKHEEENKNPFDLSDEEMNGLYDDNDNSEMWKK